MGSIVACLMRQKANIFNICIAPVLWYGMKTAICTKRLISRLRKTQIAIETPMLREKLSDRRTLDLIRERTGVKDLIGHIAKQKCSLAGYIVRETDEQWTKRVLE